eukprot:390157-Alexandrium_andersonii.AAC.1
MQEVCSTEIRGPVRLRQQSQLLPQRHPGSGVFLRRITIPPQAIRRLTIGLRPGKVGRGSGASWVMPQ